MKTLISTFSKFVKRKDSLLLLVLLISGISLIGWLIDKVILASFLTNYIPVAPSTALLFITLSVIFLVNNKTEGSLIIKSIAFALLVLSVLFCLDIFLNYFFSFGWNIENIFIEDPRKFGAVLIGRMSPLTSVLFIFSSIGIWKIGENSSETGKYITSGFALLTALVSSVLLIGYLYNAPLLYGGHTIPVALPTAVCFLLFSITLLRVLEFRFWTFNLLKDNRITHQLLRSFLPTVVGIVMLAAYFNNSISFDNINPTLISSLILLITILVSVILITQISKNIGAQLLKVEKSLQESETKLKQLNIDKDLFLSILGHDLKGPFNSILGYSNILIEQIREKDYDGINKHAVIIQKSSQRAMDLLMNLMEWAQSQSGRMKFNPEYFELVELLKDLELLLSGVIEQKSISISKNVSSNGSVFADKKMISTVLRNLISNAIKFAKPGGKIIISIAHNQKELVVSVKDNGIGIPKPNIEKLFRIDESFTTPGTQNETGTGLGLIICKDFIEKHHGKLWVESQEGKGSTFYFAIPYKDDL